MVQDMELLENTKGMLKQHIDSDTAIAIEAESEDEHLSGMLRLLRHYELAATRKMTVLACYILIRLAMQKHRELMLSKNETLTKGILDGDYLFGLYYRLVVGRKEWKLLTHLAPFHKNMQLALINGKSTRHILTDLFDEIRLYLDKQCA